MAPGGTVKTPCGKGERNSKSHTLLILIFVIDIGCVTSSVSGSRPCFRHPGNFGDGWISKQFRLVTCSDRRLKRFNKSILVRYGKGVWTCDSEAIISFEITRSAQA